MAEILINVPRLNRPGGVANYYLVLRDHLNANKEYFEIGAKVQETGGLALLKRAITDYWLFHSKLSKGRYALVHLNPSLAPKSVVRDAIFFLIARAHSVPVLVLFHGWNVDLQRRIARRFRWLFNCTYGRAAGLIVLAEDFRRQLTEIGVRAPVFRITTMVPEDTFNPRHEEFASSGLNVLFLSRLDRGKGLLEALQAFAMLKQSTPEATMTVAGDGTERRAAEDYVHSKQIDNVNFLGYVQGEAKQEVFRKADIYLFPTFWSEGLPTTVLEAMAYGLPVITRSVGGLKDFFEEGRMGFITEDSDPKTFGDLLSRLSADQGLRRAMGKFNYQYARNNFGASTVASRLERIYSDVLNL